MRRTLYLVLAVALLIPASIHGEPGRSDRVSQVEDIARKANQKYKSGEYSDAIVLYRKAYLIRQAATLLYNIALIYDRKLQDMELAERHYREYLRAGDTVPKLAARAETRLAEFARIRATLAPKKKPSPVAQTPLPAAVVVQTSAEVRSNVPTWFFWSGGVLLVTGGAIWGVAAYEAERFAESKKLDDKKTLRESAEMNALVGDIVFATGGAAMLTGLIWVLATNDDSDQSQGMNLIPTAGGLSLRGTF